MLDDFDLTIQTILSSILFFTSISVMLIAMENLYTYKYFVNQGVLSGISIFPTHSKTKKILFSDISFILLTVVKLCAALCLIYDTFHLQIHSYLIYIILLTLLYNSEKSSYGGDGSDQLNFLIFFILSLAHLIDTPQSYQNAIIFIALQSILSYMVAGIAKLLGVQWRNGTALTNILRTKTYGSYLIFKFFQKFKILGMFFCSFTIIWESLFFLVLYKPLTPFFILNALIFHILNALIMGLNNFFWSFLATYPAILFLVNLINQKGVL